MRPILMCNSLGKSGADTGPFPVASGPIAKGLSALGIEHLTSQPAPWLPARPPWSQEADTLKVLRVATCASTCSCQIFGIFFEELQH